MSIEVVQATAHVQAAHPRPEPCSRSGRDPGREHRRDDKPGQPGPDSDDQPQPVLNSLGQLTGKTISTRA